MCRGESGCYYCTEPKDRAWSVVCFPYADAFSMERSTGQSGKSNLLNILKHLGILITMNMDDTTQTKKLQPTTQSSRLHDYRETRKERARFPETSVFIPDFEDHVTFL
ncbi:hypothetical protein TNCV_1704811 [Trichonephila clavipes]|nr:hypothetical protein TNCV_1704811 [Trichonephila clavipes]